MAKGPKKLRRIGNRLLECLHSHDVDYGRSYDWEKLFSTEAGEYGTGIERGLWERSETKLPSKDGARTYFRFARELVGRAEREQGLNGVVFTGTDEEVAARAIEILDEYRLPRSGRVGYFWQDASGTLKWSRNQSDLPAGLIVSAHEFYDLLPDDQGDEMGSGGIADLFVEQAKDMGIEEQAKRLNACYAAKYLFQYEHSFSEGHFHLTDKWLREKVKAIQEGNVPDGMKALKAIIAKKHEYGAEYGFELGALRTAWQTALRHNLRVLVEAQRREDSSDHINDLNDERAAHALAWRDKAVAWAKQNKSTESNFSRVARFCNKALKLGISEKRIAAALSQRRLDWQGEPPLTESVNRTKVARTLSVRVNG